LVDFSFLHGVVK